MEPSNIVRDIEATGTVEQPWTVLVQNGTVKEVLRPEEAGDAKNAVNRLAAETGMPVSIYAVDGRLPHPPPIGSPVDPQTWGWQEIGG